MSDERWQQTNSPGEGGTVYAVQHGDQYIYLYRNKPPFAIEPFGLPDRPEALALRPPSWLLSAGAQVVSFWGRRSELIEIAEWRDSGNVNSLRLVHGPGGQGKTRFAAEFAAEFEESGWTVATVRHRSDPSAGLADYHLEVSGQGLLLIVDYAERWPADDLLRLLVDHTRSTATRLRVVLLGRSGGNWWQDLRYELTRAGVSIDNKRGLSIDETELAALTDRVHDRLELFDLARNAFSDWLGVRPQDVPTPAELHEGGREEFGLALGLLMAALVSVDATMRADVAPTVTDMAGLSSYLLERERSHWRALYARGHGTISTTPLMMSRLVHLASLTGGLPYTDALAVATQSNIGLSHEKLEQSLQDHELIYPAQTSGRLMEALQPDRLAEDFVALSIRGHNARAEKDPWATAATHSILSRALSESGPSNRSPSWLGNALAVLAAAAHRWPHVTQTIIEPLFAVHQNIGSVLAATGQRATLVQLAELPDLADAHMDLIDPHLRVKTPYQSGGFQHHRTLFRMVPELFHSIRLRTANDNVAASRRLYIAHPERYGVSLVNQLRELAHYQIKLNLISELEETWRESSEVLERLAAAGEPAIIASLGKSLSLLGSVLVDLGQIDEALKMTRRSVNECRKCERDQPASLIMTLAIFARIRLITKRELVAAAKAVEQAGLLYRLHLRDLNAIQLNGELDDLYDPFRETKLFKKLPEPAAFQLRTELRSLAGMLDTARFDRAAQYVRRQIGDSIWG
jgi:hypothetical protein